MKDIKDYFKNSSDNLDNYFSKTTNENVEHNAKSTGNQDHKRVGSSSSSAYKNLRKNGKKVGRKKKDKKIAVNIEEESDPKPISEEFIISAKGKKKYQSHTEIKEFEDNENFEEDKVSYIVYSSPENADSRGMENSPQINTSNHSSLNAFQLLMDTRNKVIGTNSPGKELIEREEITSDDQHEKLAVRKKLLRNWADSKNIKKRKLNDEEIDECIKVKLETRKKRFKALLKVESVDEEDSEVKTSSSLVESKSKKQCSLTSFGITSNNSKLNEVTLITDSDQYSLPETNTKEKLVNGSKKIRKKFNTINRKSRKPLQSSRDNFDGKDNKDSNPLQYIKKKKHKHKHRKEMKDGIAMDKSVITIPSRHWKMRIKLSDEGQIFNLENDKSEEVIDKVIHIKNEVKVIDYAICERERTINDNEIAIDKVSPRRSHSKKIKKTDYDEGGMNIEDVINDTKSNELKAVNLVENNEFKRVLRDRASLQRTNISQFELCLSDESSDESFDAKIKKKRTFKVAPVFTKAIPKPKVDPEIIEAKRKFLLSEIPDALKRTIEKQGCIIVPEFDEFPKISHIHQINPKELLYNLPSVKLPIRTDDTFEYNFDKLFCRSVTNTSMLGISRYDKSEIITNPKTIIRNIKLENTKYPVYKYYRLLKEKIGDDMKMDVKKEIPIKCNKKRNSEKSGRCSTLQTQHLMWTEKYKPISAEDIIGNFQAVSTLKKWLESWHEAFKSGKNKTKIYCSDSESDFISSDGESIFGCSSLTSTIIVTGPCGSGKSSSVYAICNELGLNVIELNASSRRTGKQVLQELQEATQSHQVRKNKESVLSFTKKNPKLKSENEKKSAKKMCVLLIEDVDIIFEQDEGFINAISQISSITKRPIILTTSNEKSIHSQKFINDFKTIKFNSLTAISMGIWLQVLCLLEGQFVDISSISELLEYNNGDVRKTLLELQFWIQSGGQISKHKSFVDSVFHIESSNEEVCPMQTDDDASNISLKQLEGVVNNFRTHSNIISDFEIFQLDRFYEVPLNFDLVKIWWNVPTFLNIESEYGISFNPRKKSRRNKTKLKMISDMFDSLALCDISYRTISYKCDTPVCSRRWTDYLQDSLEVEEVFKEYSSNSDFLFEWNHYVVNGCVKQCKERFAQTTSKCQRLLNMAMPRLEHQRKLARSHYYEEELLTPVPLSYDSDRKSVSLDYLPVLRNIARSEKNRAQITVKRHNRFHNYLQNLNIKCNNSVLSFATDTLVVNR